MTIDDLGISRGDIAIKIDIEGGELAAILRASETIRIAQSPEAVEVITSGATQWNVRGFDVELFDGLETAT